MYCRGHKGLGRTRLERFGCARIFGHERTGLINVKVIPPLFMHNTCTDCVVPRNKYISEVISFVLSFRRLRQAQRGRIGTTRHGPRTYPSQIVLFSD